MVVQPTRINSCLAADQAEQNCQQSEGAEWIEVEPRKAEPPGQANLLNWTEVVLGYRFTD